MSDSYKILHKHRAPGEDDPADDYHKEDGKDDDKEDDDREDGAGYVL